MVLGTIETKLLWRTIVPYRYFPFMCVFLEVHKESARAKCSFYNKGRNLWDYWRICYSKFMFIVFQHCWLKLVQILMKIRKRKSQNYHHSYRLNYIVCSQNTLDDESMVLFHQQNKLFNLPDTKSVATIFRIKYNKFSQKIFMLSSRWWNT